MPHKLNCCCEDPVLIVSLDAGNDIIVGTDGGAYLDVPTPVQPTSTITANFSGGGSALTDTQTLGVDMIDVPIPYGFTLTGYTVLADSAGDLTISVQETDYTDYPASFADITGANDVIITGPAQKNQDTTLTGWTTSFAADKVFRFTLTAVNGQIWAAVVLHVVKT